MTEIIKLASRINIEKVVRKRVAAYARVSVDKGRSLDSLSRQVSYYNKLIQSNPQWKFAGVYFDKGITGTSTKNRAEFNRMIEDCKKGSIDIIITKSIQRFARNTLDLLTTVRELKSINVEVYFERENISSLSADGELMLTILASFAQEEALSTSQNIKWRIRKKYEKGIPNTYFRVYGYRWKNGNLIIHEKEKEAIEIIFNNCINGKSDAYTCNMLLEMGFKPMYGKRFHDSWIRGVLTNAIYIGRLTLQKYYTVSPINGIRLKNDGVLPQYIVDNHHEHIIDEDIFNKVQKIIKNRKELDGHRGYVNSSIFTSKILCTRCQNNYRRSLRQSRAKDGNGEKQANWKCINECRKSYIREEVLIKACMEVLDMTEFSEDRLWEEIDHIEAQDNKNMTFFFKDGRMVDKKVISHLKKACWTDERRKKKSKVSIEISRKRFTEFTSRILCDDCKVYYKGKTLSKGRFWYCPNCKRQSKEENDIKLHLQKVFCLNPYSRDYIKTNVQDFIIKSNSSMIAKLNDGREVLIYE